MGAVAARGRLVGKTAIVVGAGQTPGATVGNGRATALTFAREGASVLAVDVDRASAEETVAMIRAGGGRASAFEADITKADDCAAFAAAAIDTLGRVDILHNNVGGMAGDNETHLLDEADWDRIQTINVKGMFLCCRAVLPVMRQQGGGAIINVSSTVALWSGDPFIAYNTSKAAVNGLTRAMVVECAGYGIRVNAIMPGLMDTPMGVDAVARESGLERDDLARNRDAAVPLRGRMGNAWDVANAALFLASDEARFITGAILPVDGGQLLQRGQC